MTDSDTKPENKLVEQWINHAANGIKIHGLQNKKALLFELQQAVDRLSQLESLDSDKTKDEKIAIDEELDTLGSLLLQYQASHHNRRCITEAVEIATDSRSTDMSSAVDLEMDEEAVRERIEELIHEQGVSQVSRVADTILREFDNAERAETTQIVAEVRSEAGEMETLGNPEDYPES